VRGPPHTFLAARALAICFAAALTASACGGSDDNVADFTRSDLPSLVPEKSEAPPQHAAEKKPFGFDFLEQEGGGIVKQVVRPLRARGMEDDYGIQFIGTSRKADPGYLEAIAFLFPDEDAATKGLDFLREVHLKFIKPTKDLPALDVGETSWGLVGEFFGHPAAVYGFRVGDVVLLATVSRSTNRVSIREARKLAEDLEARTSE
jgi:hypothetical protein